MKKMFYSNIRVFASIAFLAYCVCAFSTGCASTDTTQKATVDERTQTQPKQNKKTLSLAELDRRLINAERKERRLMHELDHAKTTDEIIRCKNELNSINAEIADIKHHKDMKAASGDEGFKSVKDRHYTYGPLGFVFKLTQWILEKLYLIYRS